ncbi:type II toxin-antitoxin system YafO family toxin [Pseudomonas viridiflava]|uniref:type II toxin-antitoxin system YafO family toxin n=1 Tax=Pseudomonas viridiflava TaxID=33069 RepID=UPI001C31D094|nr:type II toxin-antitoxin system YafO family toxin [Pseudomonas alliivorans]QXG49187.1 type II toxin-antitoxin system YafO family toxin [Pseudomonas viridiflava]
MAVEVFWHEGTYAELFGPVEAKHPGLSAILKSEFTRYMESDRVSLPSIFGKDDAYMQPAQAAQACLMHIHIKIPPARFPPGLPRQERKCRRGKPGEDAALVYVPGELEESRFLLLAFLWPDAHRKSRERATMRYLSSIASKWRDQN